MQQIIFGIEQIQEIIAQHNCKKLFIVAGNSYNKLEIKHVIDKIPVNKEMFSGFTPNPLYEQVCDGYNKFKTGNFDTLLAIGGGSAIDVAKCIKYAVLSKYGAESLIMAKDNNEFNDNIDSIPLFAIPTTAGSGSESTHNAVMYYNDCKQTITDDAILPDYAFLEPSVLCGLPVYQKKCTMLDALCQAIESWWSINSTTESISYSKQAISLIKNNWEKYIYNNDASAAKSIMLAANYSGRAINIAQTTAAHAMSYKISSIYKIPHGHAVAICLPEIWDYMLTKQTVCNDPRGEKYVQTILSEISSFLGVQFREILNDLQIDNPKSINKEQELELLSKSINPVRLKNNPIMIDEITARILYNKIIK